MKKKFFYLLLLIIFFYPGFSCLAFDRVDRELGLNCYEVCQNLDQECITITNDDEEINNYFCSVGDTPDECQNYLGNCATVLYDEGFEGCTNANSSVECKKYPAKQALWTYCLCSGADEQIATSSLVNDSDIGKIYQYDLSGNLIGIYDTPAILYLFILTIVLLISLVLLIYYFIRGQKK
jgi:hypothetical protein